MDKKVYIWQHFCEFDMQNYSQKLSDGKFLGIRYFPQYFGTLPFYMDCSDLNHSFLSVLRYPVSGLKG